MHLGMSTLFILFYFILFFFFQKSEKLIILFSWKRTTSQLSPTKGPEKKEREMYLFCFDSYFSLEFFLFFFCRNCFPTQFIARMMACLYVCWFWRGRVVVVVCISPDSVSCSTSCLPFFCCCYIVAKLMLVASHRPPPPPPHLFSLLLFSLFFLYFYKRDRHVHKRSSSPYLCNGGSSSFTSRVSSIL